MTLAAFLAAGVALFCAGFLTCLCINRNDARRIPEHPTIRRPREAKYKPLRLVVQQAPYNWAEEQ